MESIRRVSLGFAALMVAAPAMAAASAASPRAVPLHFEPDAAIATRYVVRDGASTFSFAGDGAIVGDASGVMRLRLSAANRDAPMQAEERLPGRSHYLRGTDPSRWRRDVPHYARLRYVDVYPGVDLVYHADQRQIEHDFIVAPAADPSRIRWNVDGAEHAALDPSGDLKLSARSGVLTLHRPVAYQQIGGARRDVVASFRVDRRATGEVSVGFDLGPYDRRHALVIDPVVTWSTLIGSNHDDSVDAMAVDSAGNVYLTGMTRWGNFPVTAGALQPVFAQGGWDAFVTKFAPDGTLVYSTYLGGNSTDLGYAIAVDSAGNAHVAGFTASTDFPTAGLPRPRTGVGDAFVAKLTSDGSALVYSTYLGGGTSYDNALAIAADAAGNTLVAGNTWNSDFPTLDALQPAFGGGNSDAFLTKLSGTTGKILFSTFLGGSGDESIYAIAIGAAGGTLNVAGSTTSANFPTANALQSTRKGGSDGFVARLAASGRSLLFSTYLGGTRDERLQAITVGADDAVYVGGGSTSADFPVLNPVQRYAGGGSSGLPKRDAIVARLRGDGAVLSFGTYLGGTDEDYVRGIAVDADQSIYIGGTTYSADYPALHAFQPFGGGFDGFVAKLRPGELLLSSPLGGQGFDFVNAFGIDGTGNLYAAGYTSGGFPTVNAMQPLEKTKYQEGFVTRIAQAGEAVPDTIEFHVHSYKVRENQGYATIRLDRTGTGYGAVSVRFLTADGTATLWDDYLPVDGGVQWLNGKLGARYVQVVVNDDGTREPSETVKLSLISPRGFAVLGRRTTATLTIRDPAQ